MWWITLRQCAYCGVCMVPGFVQAHGLDTATRDHVHPRRHGGVVSIWCCGFCNHSKDDQPLLNWLNSRTLADRQEEVKRLPGTGDPMTRERLLAIGEKSKMSARKKGKPHAPRRHKG